MQSGAFKAVRKASESPDRGTDPPPAPAEAPQARTGPPYAADPPSFTMFQ